MARWTLILLRVIAWCAFLYAAAWFAVHAYDARMFPPPPGLPYAGYIQSF